MWPPSTARERNRGCWPSAGSGTFPWLSFPPEELAQAEGAVTASSFVQEDGGGGQRMRTGGPAAERRCPPGSQGRRAKGLRWRLRRPHGTKIWKRWTMKKIVVVGLGPGERDQMTFEAAKVLERCDVLVGYQYYTTPSRTNIPISGCWRPPCAGRWSGAAWPWRKRIRARW